MFCPGKAAQRVFEIAAGPKRELSDFAHGLLEIGVASDEVGLGVDFDQRSGLGRGGNADQPLGGNPVRLLGGFRKALGTEPIDRGFHLAIALGQRGLAIHHAGAVFSRRLLTIPAVISGIYDLIRFVPMPRLQRGSILLRQLARLVYPIAFRNLTISMQQPVDLIEVVLGKGSNLPKMEDAALVELLLVSFGDPADFLEIVLLAPRFGKSFKRGNLRSRFLLGSGLALGTLFLLARLRLLSTWAAATWTATVS